MAQDREPPLIAVVGPTAAGKTAVGIALAQRIDGEVVSADAVAVYRGLDIGAAKPSARERGEVPFHLLDVADPDEDFTLADYERLGNAAIADIRRRGRIPILVGGTGLYVRAVTAILSLPQVPPQTELRARLMEEAEEKGTPALHARLAEVDPVSAGRISPNDRKRIVRALEVQIVTGRPLSAFHTPEGVHGVPRPNTRLFGLRVERTDLYARIDARVDTMLAEGFLEEVYGLLERGYDRGLKSLQSLGYRHLIEHLSDGRDLAEVMDELKRDTRRYARRQLTWFNGDRRIEWVTRGTSDSGQEEDPAETAALLEGLLRTGEIIRSDMTV